MEEKREYLLKGLTCANCAGKIEEEVRQLSMVESASINLMNEKLTLLVNDFEVEIEPLVKKIVASHESHVQVIDYKEYNQTKENNKKQDHEESHQHTNENGNHKIYFIRLLFSSAVALFVTFVTVAEWFEMTLILVAYLVVGYDILLTAGKNIIKGKVFDENFLMSVASIGAFFIGEHIEAVAVLVFYGLGETLQEMGVHRSRKNIANLMDIRPDYANVKIGDEIQIVDPEEVNPGEVIIVKPGEKIPLDGVIIRGTSFIDTRALTGESVPVEATIDDCVYSGAICISGVIEVKVTKPFGESTVSKILELVENAGSKKAESEKFITRFARYYTPVVVFTALTVAIIPPIFGFGTFSNWIYRALSFLIISCPCALVISIPLSFFGGIGGSAKHGVLIKGGNFLEALNKVDTIVFDKTGTLTKGIFDVTKIIVAEGVTEEEVLLLAANAEQYSTHPIGKSIVTYYKNRYENSILDKDMEITELAGRGMIARTQDRIIYAGNQSLMEENDIPFNAVKEVGSIVYISTKEKYYGTIIISDEIKEGVKETLQALKKMGVKKTVMLTGDQRERAEAIGALCEVDEIHAELLPQDKVTWFEHYQREMKENRKIAFVGDGINDAPVLARADIGIAMGAVGSDAAIEAADVVIMNDDINRIEVAIKIANKTRHIVIQNIVLALGVKLIVMALSFLNISSIWFAIFADVGVALIALLNAMRAMRIR